MGCDIHICCEAKNFDGALEPDDWYNVDHFHVAYNPLDTNMVLGEYEMIPIYTSRNYMLFGALAGVRSDAVEPIAWPRGLPDDIDSYTKRLSYNFGDDGHTHSYLRYNEIARWYDERDKSYKQPTEEQKEALEILGISQEQWSSLLIPDDVEYEEWEEIKFGLSSLLEAMEQRMKEVFDPYGVYGILDKRRGYDRILKEHGEDFRIVFWFDS